MSCPRAVAVAALLAGMFLTHVGCDNKPQRVGVNGQVTLDGQPLEFGSITFVPDGLGPKASGIIEAGKYSIVAARGPLAGGMNVEIRAPQVPGDRPAPSTSSEWVRLLAVAAERLPTRYNSETELRATITSDGPNEFNFELTTK